MSSNTPRHRGGWVILLSFVLAFMLTLLPIPEYARPFRPEWSALVLIYWCLALPERVGVGTAFVVGVLLDVMTGTLLGQHALGFSIIAYLTLVMHQRIRVAPVRQQALTVLVLLLLNQLLLLWIMGVTGYPPQSWTYWTASLTGTLLWPWTFIIMREVRRRYKVS